MHGWKDCFDINSDKRVAVSSDKCRLPPKGGGCLDSYLVIYGTGGNCRKDCSQALNMATI
jgi:hypothetical protein